MIILIIIAYIANIFLNRWLNKIICKMDSRRNREPIIWFFSIICTIVFLIIILGESKMFDWFTGKHW